MQRNLKIPSHLAIFTVSSVLMLGTAFGGSHDDKPKPTSQVVMQPDRKITLSAPPGGVLKSISVTVDMEPATAKATIYGKLADGMIHSVDVSSGISNLELPFAYPEIRVKFLRAAATFKISTNGYKDSAR